jgi:glycosyltransferase involved in cell wall biosynthesis
MINPAEILKRNNQFRKIEHVPSYLHSGDEENIKQPFISIVIPTYKRHVLLKEAIDSALNQTNPACDYEVVVVDNEVSDGAVTETEKLINSYNDKKLLYYKNSENIGMFGNWNRGLEIARGKWVAFLHDDDLLKPNYIHSMVQVLRRKKDIGAVLASFDIIRENDSPVELDSSKAISTTTKLIRIRPFDTEVWNANVYGPPTCGALFNKESAIKEGGFNEEFFPSADWFYLYKFNKSYKVYKTISKLGYYRVFENESLNPNTLRGFIKDAATFRELNRRNSIAGKVMYHLFKYEQHAFIMAWVKKLDKNSSISPEEFNDLCRYKIRTIPFLIYRIGHKLYWPLKKIAGIIFG